MNHRPKYKVENGKTPRRENLDDLWYDDDLLFYFIFWYDTKYLILERNIW